MISTTSNSVKIAPEAIQPQKQIACLDCPAGIWFGGEKNLSCYCQILHLKSWSTDDPTDLLYCDGKEKAEETED